MSDFSKFFEGITYAGPSLDDGDVVTDVIVLARVMRADDEGPKSALTIHTSTEMDPFVQVGLIETARRVIGNDFGDCGDDED